MNEKIFKILTFTDRAFLHNSFKFDEIKVYIKQLIQKYIYNT